MLDLTLINPAILHTVWVLIHTFIHSWVMEVLESQDEITFKLIGSLHYTHHLVTHSCWGVIQGLRSI